MWRYEGEYIVERPRVVEWAEEVLGITLYPWQRAMLGCSHSKKLMMGGRQTGRTTAMLLSALHDTVHGDGATFVCRDEGHMRCVYTQAKTILQHAGISNDSRESPRGCSITTAGKLHITPGLPHQYPHTRWYLDIPTENVEDRFFMSAVSYDPFWITPCINRYSPGVTAMDLYENRPESFTCKCGGTPMVVQAWDIHPELRDTMYRVAQEVIETLGGEYDNGSNNNSGRGREPREGVYG